MKEACILITVYNGEPWLDEALDSALATRDIDFEILVVDDGSTDGTPDILRRRSAVRPDRIRVITIPQSGLSRARNVGFESISAEFVTCLDADDRMHPLRVRLEVDALREYPDAVLSFSGRWNFRDGEDTGRYGFRPRAFRASPGQLFTQLDDPISAMLEAGEYPGTDACTCRTAWARTQGRFDPNLPTFMDGERWLRSLHSIPVVYVAAPLYQRREHGRAMSADSSAVSRALFATLDMTRDRWDTYSSRQQRNIRAFERRAGIWLGRRAGLAGDSASGRRFLWTHRRRLMSPFWWRTMAFLLVPRSAHRTWRKVRPETSQAVAPSVPLQAILVDDPALIWVSAAQTPATAR